MVGVCPERGAKGRVPLYVRIQCRGEMWETRPLATFDWRAKQRSKSVSAAAGATTGGLAVPGLHSAVFAGRVEQQADVLGPA